MLGRQRKFWKTVKLAKAEYLTVFGNIASSGPAWCLNYETEIHHLYLAGWESENEMKLLGKASSLLRMCQESLGLLVWA